MPTVLDVLKVGRVLAPEGAPLLEVPTVALAVHVAPGDTPLLPVADATTVYDTDGTTAEDAVEAEGTGPTVPELPTVAPPVVAGDAPVEAPALAAKDGPVEAPVDGTPDAPGLLPGDGDAPTDASALTAGDTRADGSTLMTLVAPVLAAGEATPDA